jgi:3-deoxy-D-manno-octulosonic-acid transferase
VPNLLDLVYLALLAVCSPWLLFQSLKTGKYRQGFAAKFLGSVPIRRSHGTCLWLHAVSVGEVNVLRTLVARVVAEYPQWELVVTTTTRTGYELACKRFAEHTVCYCPLDFSWAVRRAMRRLRPDMLVLVELELWPNLIRAARAQGAKVAVINGRLSDRSAKGYGRIRPLVKNLLRQIDLIAVQNEPYAQRFRALGAPAESVCVSGSLKFDGAETNRANRATLRLRQLADLPVGTPVFLAGSTQEPEEMLAVEAWQAALADSPELRLILVPRHPERFEAVARQLKERGVAFRRRSELERRPLDASHRVLVVDAVGELGAWRATADVAFVGGSITTRRGGQNMLEPAAYGAAVSFGPHTHNFRDIVAALLAVEGAVVVKDGAELTSFVHRVLTDKPFANELGRRAQALVESQLGATERTVLLLAGLLDEQQESRLREAA